MGTFGGAGAGHPDYPEKCPWQGPYRRTYLHVMHSVVDTVEVGLWEDGQLRRWAAASVEHGAAEDGQPLAFELPYWEGEYDDGLPEVPFHPLEFGEAALAALFGFVQEGARGADPRFDPFEVTLAGFSVV
ncbi:DUF6928 family protein [Allosalinactinospora lopnorensis]|uniref:DUF6928 family protein n=1 Tax=Allosalinactinospora lopnorensis TaxID=1352348 RepID=UPI000698F741|nr:hypothetical protein [Allosalinactinospora lopnorensis]